MKRPTTITCIAAGIAATLLTLLALAPAADAATNKEIRDPAIQLPKNDLAAAFDSAIGEMQIRLRNYGAKSGSGSSMSWHENQSYIKLPGGQQWNLGIPEWVYNVPATNKTRKWKIYVNNMITTSIDATIEGDRIVVELKFGGTAYGPSVTGRCIRRIAGSWGECAATGTANLNNALIRISLKPREWYGSVSYGHISHHTDVDFEYDLDIDHWLCGVDGAVCNFFKDKIEDELTPMVKQMIAQQLNNSDIRHQVANAIGQIPELQSLLFANHGWEIVGITDVGNAFRLDMERLLSPSFGAAVNAGSSCPKPITIVASAMTRVPLDLRVQYRIDGGAWSSWLPLDKLTEAASNLLHTSRSITTEPVNPGTRLVEARIKPFGEILWQVETYEFSKTLEVTCPLKEVSEVELLASTSSFIYMDRISKLETDCPVTVSFLGSFTEHDGAGDVSYRFRFSEGDRVSTTYSTNIEHPMLHPSYKTPTVVHELPFPLPGLPQPDDPPPGDVGGFQMQASPTGPQSQGGFQATGGAVPGNEHKGSVRLEIVTPQGSAVSDWLPYHIVCEPKTAVTPVGPMTAPQKPQLPPGPDRGLTAPRGAPTPTGSGSQEQQRTRQGELNIPRHGPGRPGEQKPAPAPAEEPARTPGQSARPAFGSGLSRQVGETNSDRTSGSSQKPSAEAAHDRNANAETNHLLEKPAQADGEQATESAPVRSDIPAKRPGSAHEPGRPRTPGGRD